MKALEILEKRTASNWEHLRAARQTSDRKRIEITAALKTFPTADASIVVVGSLAREEFTPGSDVDWTLLLDGMSRPQDEQLARDIRQVLDGMGEKQPGREGVFGTLVSSHDLIHRIGGETDTNANTTRRILLLLESVAIGTPDAHSRVLNNVLYRYLEEDRGLWFGSNQSKVPRFLFNDVARYWRTMAVDFAYKQRSRPEGGFLLRNTKLRMSRKLLFLAGMLICFDCHTRFEDSAERREFYKGKPVEHVIHRLREVLVQPPLEILASSLLIYTPFDDSIKNLFTAYDEFVGMLADDTLLSSGLTKRKHLDTLHVDRIEKDPIASEAREISHRFRDAISELFLTKDTELGRLTLEYGVF
ncbi:MAG: nucleotidyltransferase domain-containing protein [Acidobacteriaceae bacterium]